MRLWLSRRRLGRILLVPLVVFVLVLLAWTLVAGPGVVLRVLRHGDT